MGGGGAGSSKMGVSILGTCGSSFFFAFGFMFILSSFGSFFFFLGHISEGFGALQLAADCG